MSVQTDILGTDLAFNGDFQIAPSGDLDTVSGLKNVQDALLRRILTVPGSLVHRPTYGCGLLAYQNAPMTLAVQRQLAQRIAQNLPKDPRVLSVTNVSVSSSDGSPGQLLVTVNVTLVAYGAQTLKFTPFNALVV